MYQRILVAVDGSNVSNLAVLEAGKIAMEQYSHLCLVHVVDLSGRLRAIRSGVSFADIEQMIIQRAQWQLDEVVAFALQHGLMPEFTLVQSDSGHISTAIVEEAKRWHADLIVMGTHGRHGLERLFLGSVAEGVARSSPVPVLLVRGPDAEAALGTPS